MKPPNQQIQQSDPKYPWGLLKMALRESLNVDDNRVDLRKARSIIDALIYELSPRRKTRDVGRPRVRFAPHILNPLLNDVYSGKTSKRQMARVLGVSQRTAQLICENPKRYREE